MSIPEAAQLVLQAGMMGRSSTHRAVGAALAALVAAMLTKNMTADFMHQAGVIAFWGYAGILLGRLSGRVAPAAA
jgi:hypothetical protein